MTVSNEVSARVRLMRQACGWTVDELARQCAHAGRPELTAAAITNIELRRRAGPRGARPVTVDELAAFAAAFGVPTSELWPSELRPHPASSGAADLAIALAAARKALHVFDLIATEAAATEATATEGQPA